MNGVSLMRLGLRGGACNRRDGRRAMRIRGQRLQPCFGNGGELFIAHHDPVAPRVWRTRGRNGFHGNGFGCRLDAPGEQQPDREAKRP